ncbi:MAG: hypothetical protein LBT33_11395, partial [Spirochaetia bacterium]|nr:hypothetical protein [Spirochaetia bacterium]
PQSARGAPGIAAEIPQAPQGAEELQRKARFLARERQKGAHLFLNLLTGVWAGTLVFLLETGR